MTVVAVVRRCYGVFDRLLVVRGGREAGRRVIEVQACSPRVLRVAVLVVVLEHIRCRRVQPGNGLRLLREPGHGFDLPVVAVRGIRAGVDALGQA